MSPTLLAEENDPPIPKGSGVGDDDAVLGRRRELGTLTCTL